MNGFIVAGVGGVNSTYLDTVSGAVEKADAAHRVENGVAAVLQHVMSAHRRLGLPLSGEDGALHEGEVFFVQHLGHIWQLSAKKNGSELVAHFVSSNRGG